MGGVRGRSYGWFAFRVDPTNREFLSGTSDQGPEHARRRYRLMRSSRTVEAVLLAGEHHGGHDLLHLCLAIMAGSMGVTLAAATTSAAVSTVPTSSVAATGVHNDADIDFAREMIPHHQQAAAMAAMIPSRSTDSQVLDLAARIQVAQDLEIVTMNAWLRT